MGWKDDDMMDWSSSEQHSCGTSGTSLYRLSLLFMPAHVDAISRVSRPYATHLWRATVGFVLLLSRHLERIRSLRV